MQDPSKTNQELVEENTILKQRIKELEQSEAACKKMGEVLKNSGEIVSLLMDVVSDLHAYVDADLRFVYINKAYADWYGLGKADIIGKHVEDLLDEKVFRRALPHYQMALSGNPSKFENKTIDKEGQERFVSVRIVPHRSGKLVKGFFSSIIDITERKQAEEALQESERHMKLALEGTDQGLWEWDILSRKVVYDENWPRIMNLPSEGRCVDMDQWLASMDAEGRAAFEIKMTDYLADRARYYELEHRLLTENKEWKWIWTRGVATERDPSGIPLRMIGTYRDITKQKQAEEAWKESEGHFRALAEYLPETIFETDLQGKLTFVNRNAFNCFRYTPQDFAIGINIHNLIHPDDHGRAMENIRRIMCGEDIGLNEYKLLRKDGSMFPAMSHSSAILSNNEPVGLRGFIIDMTEPKRTEEALRESERKYRLLADRMTDIVWISDLNFNTTYLSPSIEFTLGVTPEERIGSPFKDQVTPETYTRVMERLAIEMAMEETAQSDQDRTVTMEMEYYHRNGSIVWMENIVSAIRNADGQLRGLQGVARDISKRKRMENALRESEERFRLLTENAKDTIWTMDMNLKYTYVSPYVKQLLDYTPEEFLTISLNEVLTPSSLEMCMQVYANELETEKKDDKDLLRSKTVEVEHIGKNRNIIPCEIKMTFIRDTAGQVTGILGYTRDITDRKQVEKEIRRRDSIYRELVEHAQDGIFTITVQGQFLLVNTKFCQMLGYTLEECLRRNILDTYPDDIRPVGTQRLADLQSGKALRFERPMKRRDGGILFVEAIAWKDSDGNVQAIVRDITERKQAEAELSESRRRLADIIEFLPDATLAISLEGRIIIWNKAIEEMTGIPATEMIGKGDYAYTIPFYGEARPQLMDLVFEDKDNIARQYPQITREGDTIMAEVFCNALYKNRGAWVVAKASPLHDQSGKIIGAIESIRDITDRKRAEGALRESEEKYRTFVEKANEAIIIAQDDILAYANPKMCEMLGKPLEVLTGNLFMQFIHQDDRAMVVDRYKRRLAGEKLPDSYEFRILGMGDVVKWVYISATLIQWEGKPATLNLLTDVTDRKRAEQELIESEERYRGIVENVIDVYYRSDKKGNIIMMSPSALSVLGYGDLSELIGKNVARDIYLVHEDRKIFLSELNREGEVHDFEVILKRKNGMPVPVSTSSRYYYGKDGSILGVEGFFRDISERKRVEHEIKDRQDMEKSILSSVPHGVFGVEHRKIFFANDAMETIFGWKPEEVVGKSTRVLFRNEEEWKEYGSNLYSMMAKETSTTFEPDIPFVRKDGREIFCRNTISRFGDDLTEGNKIVATFEDITERKRAEKFQNELEEKLQRAEKMESLGTLAGGVAHDLNNVLGIVVGYAEMLMDEMDEENPMRDDMKKILEGGNRSAAIVHDLLTLARRGVQTKKTVNLNATITDCQKLPEFEKVFSYNTHVKLQTDLELNLLNIMGSPVHLGKTIINLAANAVEAMPNGGVLKITTTNQYLDIPIHGYDKIREGDYVVLTVSDTGEGISERDIKRIFEPFYTKKIMGRSGTGLGLAVVWGTIKDHNGYINVESIEGKGTTFTLYFPVTREEITGAQISVSMSEYMGKGETILVVDDINRQRELASRMLTKLNYIVNTVASGEEAIEYLKKNKADLIVLDMIMDPGIDGLETYEKILKLNPVQKAVIVSGFSESDRVKEAQRIGAGAYVPKPYVLERLGMAVRKELDRK